MGLTLKNQVFRSTLRVLLCDDDPGTLLMLRTLFEKHGYVICGEASTGVETITQVVEKRPDVILLDIGMPMGTGLTVLPVLHEIDENICVIMLTVDNRSKSVHTAISLAAKGDTVKHYLDPDHLLDVVGRAAGLPSILRKTNTDTAFESAIDEKRQAEMQTAGSVAEPIVGESAQTPELITEAATAIREPSPDMNTEPTCSII